MTLNNLTAEQKKERKERYRKEYAKAYYQHLKENEPDKYKDYVKKNSERKMKAYNKSVGKDPDTPARKKKIIINLDSVPVADSDVIEDIELPEIN